MIDKIGWEQETNVEPLYIIIDSALLGESNLDVKPVAIVAKTPWLSIRCCLLLEGFENLPSNWSSQMCH